MKLENQDFLFLSHHRLLQVGGAILLAPAAVWTGAQREETLADDMASMICSPTNSTSPTRLVFIDARGGERWLVAISSQLARFIPDEDECHRLLISIQYENSRAGLNTQVTLDLIEVESAFRQYAVSDMGAHDLIQATPFRKDCIGSPPHDLFDVHTDLRYDYVILCHYSNIKEGNIVRALTGFSGSLGSSKYPNTVPSAWRSRW